MRPTSDQWAAWKANPVTQWFDYVLQTEFHDLTEALILGGTINLDSTDATSLHTVRQLARARALYEMATLKYDDACQVLGIDPKEKEEDDE